MKIFKIPEAAPDNYLPWDEEYIQWQNEMKRKHPIRYFLSHFLPVYMHVQYRIWIKDPLYAVKSLLFTKDHLLDLRKGEWKGNGLGYTYGHTICLNQVELALVAILREYVSRIDLDHVISLQDNGEWTEHFKKVKELDTFFKEEIVRLNVEIDEALHNFAKADKENKSNKDELYSKLKKIESENRGIINNQYLSIVKLKDKMWD